VSTSTGARSAHSTPDELLVLTSRWQQAQLHWNATGWSTVTDRSGEPVEESVVRRDFGHEPFRRLRTLHETGEPDFTPEASRLVSRDLVRLAEERGLAVLADDPMHFAVTTADGASVSLRPARRAGLVLERTAPDPGILATTNHLWTAELLVAAMIAHDDDGAAPPDPDDGDLVIPIDPDAELIVPAGSPLRALDLPRVTTSALEHWFDDGQAPPEDGTAD